MTGRQELLQKANIPKKHEVYGYQIAYYLLQNDTLAEKATSEALVELFKRDEFFHQPHSKKRNFLKKVFVKHALLLWSQQSTQGKITK